MRTDEKEMFTLDTDTKGGAAAASPVEKAGEESDEPETDETEEGVEETEEAEEQDATPPGVGPKKKHVGPPPGHPRWETIYAKSKKADQYSQFGSPEQVEQDLKRLRRYDEQIDAATKKGEADTEETEEIRQARDRVKKQLVKMFPWLEQGEDAVKDAATHRDSLRQRAGEATVEVMESQGIEVDQDSFNSFSKVMQEIIASDRRLFLIYRTDPARAVKEAAEVYAQPFRQAGERKKNAALIRGKQPHAALPKAAPRSTGAPAGGKAPTEPQTVKEAEAMFTARLRSLKE